MTGTIRIITGDCRDVLSEVDTETIDACVTDPPYGLGFMGHGWDKGVPGIEFWQKVYRVLKPGSHLLSFGGTRTYHRMVCAIEDAGFEIRDQIGWVFGSGFPKSLDVSKTIDKEAYSISMFAAIRAHIRKWRDVRGYNNKSLNDALGLKTSGCGMARHWTSSEGRQHSIPSKDQWRNLKRILDWPDCELDVIYDIVKDGADRPILGTATTSKVSFAPGRKNDRTATILDITAPATSEAAAWQGWGTALKPAWEPIVVARKPLIGTVAANVLAHGTGALNIDRCRVQTDGEANPSIARRQGAVNHLSDRPAAESEAMGRMVSRQSPEAFRAERAGEAFGRWPANLVHDGSDEVLACFPSPHGAGNANYRKSRQGYNAGSYEIIGGEMFRYGDTGSAARFFYCAKASPSERGEGNNHPTVKPVELMRWLVRLVTPPGGTVLDPFAGSGTTGLACSHEQFRALLIEHDPAFAELARRRINEEAGLFSPVAAE